MNYVGFFDDIRLKTFFASGSMYQYVIFEGNYLYLKPSLITNPKQTAQILFQVFKEYGYTLDYNILLHQCQEQENNYVRIISNVNTIVANKLMKIKTESLNRT